MIIFLLLLLLLFSSMTIGIAIIAHLWALKEFQHITGQALTIEVKRRADVKGFAQSFTSKNGGQCVEFYIKSRERTAVRSGV